MTSLAFVLGVFPLVIATGASAASRQAMGTGVFGGMIIATFIAPIFIPLFFATLARKPKPKELIKAKRKHAQAEKVMKAKNPELGDEDVSDEEMRQAEQESEKIGAEKKGEVTGNAPAIKAAPAEEGGHA